jgi:hypothetical protein
VGRYIYYKNKQRVTTGTDAKIVLTDGAPAQNVFFVVEGALTSGTNTALVGTFLVRDAIVLNTGTTLTGRGIIRSGGHHLKCCTASCTPEQCLFRLFRLRYQIADRSDG